MSVPEQLRAYPSSKPALTPTCNHLTVVEFGGEGLGAQLLTHCHCSEFSIDSVDIFLETIYRVSLPR